MFKRPFYFAPPDHSGFAFIVIFYYSPFIRSNHPYIKYLFWMSRKKLKSSTSSIVFIQLKNQRDFSTVGKLVAFDALGPYLVG
jgi:hypothetical protein